MKSTIFFIAILSLPMHSVAIPAVSERTFRIPLERRSRYTGDPISNQSSKGEPFLRAHRVARMVSFAHEKYKNAFATYERNTGSRHPLDTLPGSPSTGPSKRDAGYIPLVNEWVEMWYGTITVGKPPQKFTMDFDTGSSDTWVPSEGCLETCKGHSRYQPLQSNTSQCTGRPFVLSYGSGTVAGVQYTDVVDVGGYEIRSQTIGGASLMSPGFWNNRSLISVGNYAADGLAGLAFPEISQFRGETLLESLAKHIPRKVLGFLLFPSVGRSYLTIGEVLNTVFKNDTLVSLPVTKRGYWQIQMDFISRSSNYVVPTSANRTAIADTGTTLVVLPAVLAEYYYAGVDGAKCDHSTGICTVPCASINGSIPTFGLGGRNFTVLPRAYNLGPTSEGSSDCMTGIGVSSTFEFVILGDVFLQSVYTIFDFDKDPSVKFAELVAP